MMEFNFDSIREIYLGLFERAVDIIGIITSVPLVDKQLTKNGQQYVRIIKLLDLDGMEISVSMWGDLRKC